MDENEDNNNPTIMFGDEIPESLHGVNEFLRDNGFSPLVREDWLNWTPEQAYSLLRLPVDYFQWHGQLASSKQLLEYGASAWAEICQEEHPSLFPPPANLDTEDEI